MQAWLPHLCGLLRDWPFSLFPKDAETVILLIRKLFTGPEALPTSKLDAFDWGTSGTLLTCLPLRMVSGTTVSTWQMRKLRTISFYMMSRILSGSVPPLMTV